VEQAFEDFNSKAHKLVLPDPKRTAVLKTYVSIEMRFPEGLDGKTVLNGLTQYAIECERQQIARDLQVIVQNRLRELDTQLETARVDYAAKKDARIAELGEAIVIARSLGLKRPSTPSSLGQAGIESAGNVMRTEVNSQQIPLYFMGTDALVAEQQALRKRTSDDFADPRVAEIRKEQMLLEKNRDVQVLRARENVELFLRGIEPLRAERARLGAIKTDMKDLRLVSIDRLAVDPASPVGPRKSLFVVLGLVVGGGALGVIVALLLSLLSKSNPERRFAVAFEPTVIASDIKSPPLVARAVDA